MQALHYQRRMISPRLEQEFHDRLFVPNYKIVFTIKNQTYTFSNENKDIAEGLILLGEERPQTGYFYTNIKELDLDEDRIYAIQNLFQKKSQVQRSIEIILTDLLN